jgi:hypothetical protein
MGGDRRLALIAVRLTAIGLYGVLSQAVTQQCRDISIRMALGARSVDVLSHVLRNALRLITVGLVLGAFALIRVMKSLLYEVSPLDPLALTLAAVSMYWSEYYQDFFRPAARHAWTQSRLFGRADIDTEPREHTQRQT